MSDPKPSTALRRDTLGVASIVFLVLAAVAPLTGVVVVASLAIALGNGGGAPASFLIVAVILLLFAVGYAQMSKQLVNAGGFYAFVLKGLGRTGGLIAGLIATLGYNFFVVGTIGTSGFFMQAIIGQLTGVDIHWYVWGLLSIVVCFIMARTGVDFSSKVLGVALVLEVGILVIFDVAVLVQTGYDISAFSPEAIFSGSLPIGLLLAATGYLGFEATALFSEEAKNPLKTVPRATYTAIVAIGVILGVTTWAVVSAIGVAQAQQVALEHLATGDLIFSLSEQYLGPVLTTMTFRTPDEAVLKANNSPYGLSAGVWTEKGSRAMGMAAALKAGVIWDNTFNRFDPAASFGGYKESGFGREGGPSGLAAYLETNDEAVAR